MAEKTNKNIEREYTIPLRTYARRVPRYKKVNRVVKGIKEFLVRHMQVRDRDLKKIKIDKHLNEMLWFRGIKKPPAKIKVKAIKDDKGIVKVEAVELIDKIKFKKLREEKREQTAQEIKDKKKSIVEKAKEATQKKSETSIEKKEEVKEKKDNSVKKKVAKKTAKKTSNKK